MSRLVIASAERDWSSPFAASLWKLWDGQIGVKSKPGKGSAFFFDLPPPAVSGEERRKHYRSDTSREAIDALVGKKVFVVDDNELNREIACGLLAEFCCVAVGVASGTEPIERLRSESFDLVLLDLEMLCRNARHGWIFNRTPDPQTLRARRRLLAHRCTLRSCLRRVSHTGRCSRNERIPHKTFGYQTPSKRASEPSRAQAQFHRNIAFFDHSHSHHSHSQARANCFIRCSNSLTFSSSRCSFPQGASCNCSPRR